MSRSWPVRAVIAAATVGAVLASACGGGAKKAPAAGANQPTGHVALRFSGAVQGTMDQAVVVACSPPVDPGDGFGVSIDAPQPVVVGGRRFLGLDFATPTFKGPRTYELKRAVASEPALQTNDFLLLFEEYQSSPFVWDERESSGSVTVDAGETSGRIAFRGWKNSTGAKIDVAGSFRCGNRTASRNSPGHGTSAQTALHRGTTGR